MRLTTNLLLIFSLLVVCCGFTSGRRARDYGSPELNALADDLYNALQSRINYGDATDGSKGQNLDHDFEVVADTGSANTEFAVTHALGRAPVGVYVVNPNKAGSLYASGTTWTSTTIYLKFSAANAAITIVIF